MQQCMAQALQRWVVAAHVKAMIHAPTISCVKGAATRIPWNILSLNHAARTPHQHAVLQILAQASTMQIRKALD